MNVVTLLSDGQRDRQTDTRQTDKLTGQTDRQKNE